MDELSLHKRIAELEARNVELLSENKQLREMLGLPKKEITPKVEVVQPALSINKYSSPEEKIELFQSLFRGRTDVYAKGVIVGSMTAAIIFPLVRMSG